MHTVPTLLNSSSPTGTLHNSPRHRLHPMLERPAQDMNGWAKYIFIQYRILKQQAENHASMAIPTQDLHFLLEEISMLG